MGERVEGWIAAALLVVGCAVAYALGGVVPALVVALSAVVLAVGAGFNRVERADAANEDDELARLGVIDRRGEERRAAEADRRLADVARVPPGVERRAGDRRVRGNSRDFTGEPLRALEIVAVERGRDWSVTLADGGELRVALTGAGLVVMLRPLMSRHATRQLAVVAPPSWFDHSAGAVRELLVGGGIVTFEHAHW